MNTEVNHQIKCQQIICQVFPYIPTTMKPLPKTYTQRAHPTTTNIMPTNKTANKMQQISRSLAPLNHRITSQVNIFQDQTHTKSPKSVRHQQEACILPACTITTSIMPKGEYENDILHKTTNPTPRNDTEVTHDLLESPINTPTLQHIHLGVNYNNPCQLTVHTLSLYPTNSSKVNAYTTTCSPMEYGPSPNAYDLKSLSIALALAWKLTHTPLHCRYRCMRNKHTTPTPPDQRQRDIIQHIHSVQPSRHTVNPATVNANNNFKLINYGPTLRTDKNSHRLGGGIGGANCGDTNATPSISDNWMLSSGEIRQVLLHWEVPDHISDTLFHDEPNLQRAISKTLHSRLRTQDTSFRFIPFCDSTHFRVVFALGNNFYLFDSLGYFGTFVVDIWPHMQGITPDYKLHKVRLRPQSDSITCGVWILWAIRTYMDYVRDDPGTDFADHLKAVALSLGVTDLGNNNLTSHSPSSTTRSNLNFILNYKAQLRTTIIPRTIDPRIEFANTIREQARLTRSLRGKPSAHIDLTTEDQVVPVVRQPPQLNPTPTPATNARTYTPHTPCRTLLTRPPPPAPTTTRPMVHEPAPPADPQANQDLRPARWELRTNRDKDTWVCISWNVNGYKKLTQGFAGHSTLDNFMHTCGPTILMLQELWLRRGAKGINKKALRNYTIYKTMVKDQHVTRHSTGRGRTKAGVMTAVHKDLRPTSMTTVIPTSEVTQGYILPLLLHAGPTKTLLINAYIPLDPTTLRAQIMSEVNTIVNTLRHQNPSLTVIMGGDLNAAVDSMGRPSRLTAPQDRQLSTWMTTLDLIPLQSSHSGPYTYRPHGARLRGTNEGASRIDHWLIDAHTELQASQGHDQPLVITDFEHGSDHDPILIRIRPTDFDIPGAPVPTPKTRRIMTPFTPDLKTKLSDRLLDEVTDETRTLKQSIHNLDKGKSTTRLQTKAHLSTVANAIDDILQRALRATMEEVGEPPAHNPTGPSGKNKTHPLQTGHLSTSNKAKYEALQSKSSKARAAYRQLINTTQTRISGGESPPAATEFRALYPEVTASLSSKHDMIIGEWITALTTILRETKSKSMAILKAHNSRKALEYSMRMDRELRYSTKQAHRKIFAAKGERHNLDAVKLANGTVSTDQATIMEETIKHFTNTSTSTVPPQQATNFPWMDSTDPFTKDHFTLPKVSSRIPANFKVGSLYNIKVYYETLYNLPGRKTPGKDGVPNEVLKHLPEEFHQAIHSLFVLMWQQAITPTEWKTALTILLYKKDDPHLVKNYRPIGLLNTIYKMWTAVVTKCLAMFVEQHDLLSDSQEGFRPDRNTTRQLQRLIMTMEDAKLTDSPLYVLYVDFVNAFGSVDHLRMAEIMKLQGYPEDIVSIITDLYQDANTVIRTAAGDTPPVPVLGRGTVQGDPLSPLLFIIAIDPLLRWLEQGGRAYALRTSVGGNSDLAYADDLAILAASMKALVIQAHKVQAYCIWAGFEVNIDPVRKNKTAWTGPISTNPSEQTLIMMNREIPKLKVNESYVYLGVHVNLNLSWTKHVATLTQKLKDKSVAIKTMTHTPELVMRTLEMVLRPTARYCMTLGILSWDDVAKLNSIFGVAAKYTVGLSKHTSNLTLMRPRPAMGVGVDPLHLTYAVTTLQTAQGLLNGESGISRMWKGIYDFHRSRLARYNHFPPSQPVRTSHPVLNMMAQLNDIGVEWEGHGIEIPPEPPSDNIYNTLVQMNADRTSVGLRKHSTSFMKPLWELGLSNIHQLADRGGTTLLTHSDLKRKYPDLHIKPKHAGAVRKLNIILGAQRGLTIPTHHRPQIRQAAASIVEVSQWETIPDPVRREGDHELRQQLQAGDPQPPTYMMDTSRGQIYTHEVGEPDQKRFKSTNTRYETPPEFSMMQPTNMHDTLHQVEAVLARRTVRPSETITKVGRKKKRQKVTHEGQVQYLIQFEGLNTQGLPHPPEWQPAENIEGDPDLVTSHDTKT